MLTQKEILRNHDHPPSKIQEFLDEFPWVKQYLNDTVSQVHVSEIEPALLKYCGQEHRQGGRYRTYSLYERILLLDENGSIIISKNKEFTGRTKYWALGWLFGQPRIYEPVTGEVCSGSVGWTIHKLGDEAKSVRFILSWFPYYTSALILYKIPEGVTLPEWIEEHTTPAEQSESKAKYEAVEAELRKIARL